MPSTYLVRYSRPNRINCVLTVSSNVTLQSRDLPALFTIRSSSIHFLLADNVPSSLAPKYIAFPTENTSKDRQDTWHIHTP